jgi:outer membrane protein assembly factor BamD
MTGQTMTMTRMLGLMLVALTLTVGGCATGKQKVPEGTSQPDKFLFDRGNEALAKKKWISAREYFSTIVETYPQSPYRADAKLGVGDSLIGEGTAASQVQALQEFREFLSFFPTHARADYAQYKLAMAHYSQMAKPERDQTETREAIREFDVFFERYPNSKLVPEARKFYRETRDRSSESEYRVGLFYHRARWYPGAIDRFNNVLKTDPEFTNRDAVYFYLAEALIKVKRPAEALPHLEKLVQEFEVSEFLPGAQKMIAEIKNPTTPEVTPASTAKPDETKKADDTKKPDETKKPEDAKGPVDSKKPVEKGKPVEATVEKKKPKP